LIAEIVVAAWRSQNARTDASTEMWFTTEAANTRSGGRSPLLPQSPDRGHLGRQVGYLRLGPPRRQQQQKRHAEMPSAQHISMTRQAYTRLKDELAALRGRPSLEVPDDCMDTNEDRDDYRARRSRVGVIEKLLADSIVDDNSADDLTAAPGSVVTVHYDSGATETFVLGGHGAGDEDNKVYPLRSPVGRAVAGSRPGQHRTFTLPGGPSLGVTLLKVEPAAQSAMAKRRSPTVARSRRRRPQAPGTTAAGLRELLTSTNSESKPVGTSTVPRVRAALHPSMTNAVRTSVCGTFDRQATS
jgi:transcription elongation factor GreA